MKNVLIIVVLASFSAFASDPDIVAIFGDLEVCANAVNHAIENSEMGSGKPVKGSKCQGTRCRVKESKGLVCPLCGADMSHLTVMDHCPDCGAVPEEY